MIRLPLVAAMLAGVALAGQETVGTVVGTIRTDKGAVISSVRVQIAGDAILGSRSMPTDASGNFRFMLLPSGTYTITISKDGYIGSKATFRIDAGQTFRQDLRMREVGSSTTEVEITASSENVQVDKTDTKTATSIPVAKLAELPVSLTSQGALFLAPGVSGSSDYPAFRGAPGGASQFLINGVSVRDNFLRYGRQTAYVIQDLTEGVQVIQSPLNAKYGNTSGGIVNLTTKTGTNNFSASFRADFDRPDWYSNRQSPARFYRINYTNPNSTLPQMLYSKSTVQDEALDRSYQLTVTGPIIKNHLTFSYGRTWSPFSDETSSYTNIISAANNYGHYYPYIMGYGAAMPGYTFGATSPTHTLLYQAKGSEDIVNQYKLYWLISSSHQLEFNYTQDDSDLFDNQFGNLEPSPNRQKSTRTLAGLNYTGIIGNGVLDVKYGKTKKAINWSSGFDDPVVIRTWRDNGATGASIENYNAANATSATYITNGDRGSADAELRQNETYSANYYWSNGTHSVDIGVERLKETGLVDVYNGMNNKRFFVPGISADKKYAVYNYFLSPLNTDAWRNANYSRWAAITATGAAYIPEYLYYTQEGDDMHNYDTSDAFYLNDLWLINNKWTVMAGLRFDKWTNESHYGTDISSSDISPRLEVKYDINGDNRQILSLSYAHFRGTLGFGNLGSYQRRPGNITVQNYWSATPASEYNRMTLVELSDILNTNNYTESRRYNADFGKYITSDLKPELSRQIEFAYRRSFSNGGFIRSSIVYRKFEDNLYRRGVVNVLTDEIDWTGSRTTIENWLDYDPDNPRRYYGIEFEWSVPLYRTATSYVEASGFWTSSRSKGRVTWGDENATTAIRFDDIYAEAGYNIDEYDAFGEYASSRHNRFNFRVTWTYGNPGQVQSTLGVLGQYTTGAPTSYSLTEYLPGVASGDTRPRILPVSNDTPGTLAYFLGGGRGVFTGPDAYYVDLKWSLSIPIYNKLRAFTELTIGNVFNDLLVSGYLITENWETTNRIRIPGIANTTTQYSHRINTSNVAYSIRFGTPSGYTTWRTYGFSCGLRF
jgi:hypothetical protein